MKIIQLTEFTVISPELRGLNETMALNVAKTMSWYTVIVHYPIAGTEHSKIYVLATEKAANEMPYSMDERYKATKKTKKARTSKLKRLTLQFDAEQVRKAVASQRVNRPEKGSH